MPTLNDEVRRRLVAKYGTSVNLESRSGIVSELLQDIASGLQSSVGQFDPGTVAAYDRTYTEGYNREDYSRGAYTKYDRTVDKAIFENIVNELRPELDKLIMDKLRAGIPR